MRKKGLWKKFLSCMIVAGLGLSAAACGNDYGNHEKGVANTDVSPPRPEGRRYTRHPW